MSNQVAPVHSRYVLADEDGDNIIDVFVNPNAASPVHLAIQMHEAGVATNELHYVFANLPPESVRGLMRICAIALGEGGMADFIATLRREQMRPIEGGDYESAEVGS